MTPARFDAAGLGRAYDVPAVREQRSRTRELLGPVDRDASMVAATGDRTGLACRQAEATALPLADATVAAAWRSDLLGHAERGTWWFALTQTATVVTRG